MLTLDDVRNLAQIISIVGLMFVLWQILIAKNAAVGKNTIDLISFLQRENNREARTYVIKKLGDKFPFGDSEAEEMAATVVSSYDLAAILIREKYVNKSIFVDDFGASIIRCHDKLDAFIKERQRQAGPRYWNDIGDLVSECRKVHNSSAINSASWTGMG